MKSKIAIVTGASDGIGRATALRLAGEFTGLVLVARRAQELGQTASEVERLGAETLVLAIDLSLPDSPRKIIEQTTARFGRIDALVNIAGAVPMTGLFEMNDLAWEQAEALKLHGARRLTLQAWALLKASHGSVVFMSGNAAESPKPANAAVAVINAAIIALAKAFAVQGIDDGVQVNSILPGTVITARREKFLENLAISNLLSVEQATRKYLSEIGVGRAGQPHEIAGLIAFLLSDEAKWLTGEAIRMDGGEFKGI